VARRKVVEKAYVFRLYPTSSQANQINKTMGCVRFVYNYFLDKRITSYKENKENLGYKKCSALLTKLKQDKEYIWLQEVDKFALQNSLKDLDKAYANFFRERAKGNTKQGFPKYKSKHKTRQKYRTNYTNDNVRLDIEAQQIKLPKLGWVKLHKSKNLIESPGKIINVTVNKTSSGKYFASVLYLAEIQELPETKNNAGYDLGLKIFANSSNDDTIENPRYFRTEERKLTRLQRQLSRKAIGSNNRQKQRIQVARQHERITNLRKDFLHQQSTRIVRENQVICLEDLQIKNMIKNRRLAKSISDAGWGMFRQMIIYKANWYGRTVVIIDKFYPSSKKCNECGEINPMLTLSIREWQCPKCGQTHDRDKNAAQNILAEGLRLLSV